MKVKNMKTIPLWGIVDRNEMLLVDTPQEIVILKDKERPAVYLKREHADNRISEIGSPNLFVTRVHLAPGRVSIVKAKKRVHK